MAESTTYHYDVFISYSHADRLWVWNRLLPRLEQSGLSVCIDDRDFAIGTPTLINLEQAIDSSRHIIVVLTPNWIESEWTEFESLIVGSTDPAGRRQRLLPIMLRTCQPPARIAMLTYADFRVPQSRNQQFQRLLQQLRTNSTKIIQSSYERAPFVVGPPITNPQYFFGRERELRRIFNVLKRTPLQNTMVTGPRRSGKTSLLLHLRNITTHQAELRLGQRVDWVPPPDRYKWVFLDFQDPRLSSRERVLQYLLEQLNFPIAIPCTMEYFMDVTSRNLRTPTVILMDEIDVAIERYTELDVRFWEGLRSLGTNHVEGNLAFILAAHSSVDELARYRSVGSPFFNIFGYNTVLKPLLEVEARELIASSPIRFPVADVEWIIERSGNWPMLLQLLCFERLCALENNESGNDWRSEALQQLAPFQNLLQNS